MLLKKIIRLEKRTLIQCLCWAEVGKGLAQMRYVTTELSFKVSRWLSLNKPLREIHRGL